MRKFLTILAIMTTIVVFNTQTSVFAQNMSPVSVDSLKTRTVNVPAGATFKAVTTTPIDTTVSVAGQSVTMVLISDFVYLTKLIAPKGSSIVGSVIETSSAKHGNVNAKLFLRFTQIITPTGMVIPISAVVKTEDNSGILIGGVDESSIKDIAGSLNYVTNSNSPLAVSAMGRDNSVVRDVGTGGGLLKSIWDKGADISIPVNTSIELLLLQPITVNLGNTEMEIDE